MRSTLSFIALLLAVTTSLPAADPTILTLTGATMGTTYSVKIFDPPQFDDDIQFEVDAELRRINDQMSTYLKTSEISRFNQSKSTDWFEVSDQFANVVQFAQSVSEKSDGAFDITINPLVNAWSFGAEERTKTIPNDQTINTLKESIGFEKLTVRSNPPALKKSQPDLTIDLSAIAKGHGVDRLIKILNSHGAENVFVEIGGEVRVSGDKAGQWWKVGIQVPDSDITQVMIAHSLGTGAGDDRSMATSGDYRNFFLVDGVRYSHTIDPRTGRPIEHDLASVSVVAKTCIEADAWATAINVLGGDSGLAIAEAENLDVLLVKRTDTGFEKLATGAMTAYVTPLPAVAEGPVQENNTLAVMFITFIAFAVLTFAMSVGVIFGSKPISGSCGGVSNTKDADGNVSCSLCSNPDNACKELRQRMRNA